MSYKSLATIIIAICLLALGALTIMSVSNDRAKAATVSPYDRRKAAEDRLANLLDVTYQQGVIDGCKP